jgi:hypothetical protein
MDAQFHMACQKRRRMRNEMRESMRSGMSKCKPNVTYPNLTCSNIDLSEHV